MTDKEWQEELEWREEFVHMVKRKLVARNMKRRELAKAAGISENTMSRYMRRQRTPSASVVARIADALDCSVDELTKF